MSKTQVKKEHYDFNKYVNIERWNSYYYQLVNAMGGGAINSILLIGVGDGIVSTALETLGYKVTTFDFDESLKPDIVGSVTEIEKIVKQKYDCVVCCQVLEHLPFENFEKVIRQFRKIAKKRLVLSLPYCRRRLLVLKMAVPKIKIRAKILVPLWLRYGFRFEVEGGHEHYWEIGINRKECSKRNIRRILEKYFTIEKEFNPVENVYHVFWVLG